MVKPTHREVGDYFKNLDGKIEEVDLWSCPGRSKEQFS
jgi:hypothetical protein